MINPPHPTPPTHPWLLEITYYCFLENVDYHKSQLGEHLNRILTKLSVIISKELKDGGDAE